MATKAEKRIDQLLALDFSYSPKENSYILDDFNVSLVELKTLNEDEWEKLLYKIMVEIKRRARQYTELVQIVRIWEKETKIGIEKLSDNISGKPTASLSWIKKHFDALNQEMSAVNF